MNHLATILWHYAVTRRNRGRWHDRHELEAWQDRAVKKHLAHILQRSPFYRHRYLGKSLDDWRDFPITDKADLTANFDTWNTAGIHQENAMAIALQAERSRNFVPTIGDITVGLSSGTSGSRSLFLVSPAERHAWAGAMLAKIVPDSIFSRHRAALCFRANSNLYSSVQSRFFQFRFFDLLESPQVIAQKLNEYQPTLLIAPPGLLHILSQEKIAGRLNIRPMRIFSVAEVLEPQERTAIEAAFAPPLHEIYQATEGFLATTCSEGRLHLNEDVVVIQKQWIDQPNRKFMPIITDFRRTTQPVLRYRLNDILTEHEGRCPCGSIFTALEKIEGRCDDILQLRATSGGKNISVFPDFIRRAIIIADPSISEYSATYHPENILEIALEVSAPARAQAEQSVRNELLSLCAMLTCQCPEIIFTSFTPPSPREKRRRVVAAGLNHSALMKSGYAVKTIQEYH